MKNFIDKAKDAFNRNFLQIIFTITTVFFLSLAHKKFANNITIYLFFISVIITSIILMIVFLNLKNNGKKGFSNLFNKSFLSLLSAIIALMASKTMFAFNLFPIIMITVSVYLFYNMLHGLYIYFQSK